MKASDKISIVEKVRKLMTFSAENGATEGEIENALKLAQRLMINHNIEQSDLGLSSHDIDETIVESSRKGGTEAVSFEFRLVNCIAQANNCQVARSTSFSMETGSNYFYRIVGKFEDREIVKNSYLTILPMVRNLTKTRYSESDKSLTRFKFTASYHEGFVTGLRQRLKKDREDFFKESDYIGEQYGLMIVKLDELVTQYLVEKLKCKASNMRKIELDYNSFKKGREDGSQSSLKNQLKQ